MTHLVKSGRRGLFMKSSATRFAISILLLFGASSHAENSCKLADPLESIADILPCPGSSIKLNNPKDCGSCAIKENSARTQRKKNEYQFFLENSLVEIRNGYPNGYAFTSDGTLIGQASCLDKVGDKIGFVEFVRRREYCKIDQIGKSDVNSYRASAKTAAETDLKTIAALTPEDKTAMIENQDGRMNDYILKHGCQKGARALLELSGPIQVGKDLAVAETEVEVKKLSQPQLESAIEVHKQAGVRGNWFCTSEPKPNYSRVIGYRTEYEASIRATEFFGNNSAALKDPDALKARIEKEIDDMQKKHGGCLGKLKSIEVSASSNKIQNGAPWDAWDFKSLTEARANSLLKVLPKVNHPDFLNKDLSGTRVILGDGGSGSSGPCPYELVETGSGSGVYRLNRTLKAPATEKERKALDAALEAFDRDPASVPEALRDQVALERAKNVKMSLHFTQSDSCSKRVSETPYVGSVLRRGCLTPKYECIP
jgi:hypothetical protein